jgi:hypothetical protein
VLLLPLLRTSFNPLLPDFIEYWAAGHLILRGQNPYGTSELLGVQRPLGWPESGPLMMWNPPWTLPLVMPFGLLEYGLSRLLWYFLQVVMIIYCADQLWRIYGGPKRWRWVGWGMALASSYTIYVLVFGQISTFILLGMVGFVALVERPAEKRASNAKILDCRITDFFAGAASVLISIKPQAFYLFFPLLLVWAFTARRLWVLFGLGGGLSLSLLIAIIFNPSVVGQYIQAVQTYPPENWATPTLGYWARLIFGTGYFWLQFPSILVGLAWAGWYWQKKRQNHITWSWAQELPLLATVALVTTAYAWTHDQVILIPTSMHILAGLVARPGRWQPAAILWAVAWAVFHLGTIPLHFGQSDDKFVWQAPVILALYLVGLMLISAPDSGVKQVA